MHDLAIIIIATDVSSKLTSCEPKRQKKKTDMKTIFKTIIISCNKIINISGLVDASLSEATKKALKIENILSRKRNSIKFETKLFSESLNLKR